MKNNGRWHKAGHSNMSGIGNCKGSMAQKFANDFVEVESINGWNYHTVVGDPSEFGAVEGFDENITMFRFAVFPDGSRFAIVPGQVGNSVCNW